MITFRRIILTLAVMVFFLRFFITPRLTNIPTFEGTYEAISHMIVGFLILLPFYDREQALGPSKALGTIGWLLATTELIMFMIQKYVIIH